MRELRELRMIRAIGMRAPHTFAEQWGTGDDARTATTTRWVAPVRPDPAECRDRAVQPAQPLDTEQETDIFAFARRHHVGVLIKQALGQGLLLRDPASQLPVFGPADHRSRDPQLQPTVLAALDRVLAALRARFGTDPADLARIRCATSCSTPLTRPCWSASATPTRSPPPLTCLGDPLGQDEVDQIIELFHPRTDERTPIRAVHRG